MVARNQMSPLLVIVGETASGKSSLALQLAQRFNGEVICADSATVRRGADIGTAKPTAAEQALVPHHLLSIVGPTERFNVADFQRLAKKAIREIAKRNKLPIMVGGTGLYIDSLLYDYSFLAVSRDAELYKKDLGYLQKKALDMGLSLETIDSSNKRRLVRLIETQGAKPTKKPLRSNTLIFGLTVERGILEQRISVRLDNMLKAGLEQEVSRLVQAYGWDSEALKGIGYAQWKGYFEATQDLASTRSSIIRSNLNLAKRQRTWFKRNKSIQWLSTPVDMITVVDTMTTFLSN